MSLREGLNSGTRRLRRAPAYSLAVLLNLALGIGAATAIFAVLYSIVLRPLPYPHADRLVLIEHEMPGITAQGQATIFGGFQGQVPFYAERSQLIEHIGAYSRADVAIQTGGGATFERSMTVTAGYLRALGAAPEAGRLFDDEEPEADGPGAGTVLLGHDYWRSRHGADAAMVGRQLRIDGIDARVVGVLGSQGPFPEANMGIWAPRTASQIRRTPQLLVGGFVARLVEGAEPEQLQRELDALIGSMADAIPDDFVRRTVREGRLRSLVIPLRERVVGPVASSLWLLLGAGGLVLLAALANATGLQLLRGEEQHMEMAVRRALGAGPGDLVRLQAVESALLAGSAVVGGVVSAALGVGWLRIAGPEGLPRVAELAVDGPSLLFAAALGVVCAGWLTSVRLVFRPRAGHALRGAATGVAGARSNVRLRTLATAAEIAVAVVLLVAAGLILRTFVALESVDPGFDQEGVLTFRAPFPFNEVQAVGGVGAATPFYDDLAARLAARPGIESAAYARCSPFSRTCGLAGLTLRPADAPATVDEEHQLFGILQAAPGYLETMAIPLLQGRTLESRDHKERTNNVVVSESVAEALWPGDSPLGRRIAMPDLPSWTPLTVVGVVDESRHTSLRGAPESLVYMPVVVREQQFELYNVTFLLRTSVPPMSVVEDVRRTVRELRADIPVAHLETLTNAVARSTSNLRFAVAILAAAAAGTLLLAATGIYSVIAYSVSLRRAEFGIRLALGAQPSDLRRLVLRQAALVAALGLGFGLAIAVAGGRALQSILFGIASFDPATFAGVAIVLATITIVASLVPAARAARTAPAEVLRPD